MGIYLFVFLKLPMYNRKKKSVFSPGISVIICAKNEEYNLEQFLPHVLQQDYPEFEVVVVNDSSTDDTEHVLMQLAAQFDQLRYTSIPADDKLKRGKKLALTIGLKAAKYDHVLLSDADCYPVSDHWLQRMASNFSEDHKIVLGYGGYERSKGLLNTLIRYETTFTAIQYLSYAIKGNPYMGVGRNLAYEKALFFDNKGFAGHNHLISGDDDLFVNQNATGLNCAVEFSPESHTLSLPETTFRAWSIPVGALFGILLLTRLVIFKMGMRRLDEKYLLLPSLLLDPVLPLFMGTIWLSSRFDKKYQTWR